MALDGATGYEARDVLLSDLWVQHLLLSILLSKVIWEEYYGEGA